MSQKIELTLPADFKFSPLLREVSGRIFDDLGFTEAWSGRLKLVLEELFNNAVEYGSNEISQVYITFLFDEQELSFQVEDEGTGPKKIYPLELHAIIKKNREELDANDQNKDGGRGLALISRLWADRLSVENSSHGGLLLGFRKEVVRKQIAPLDADKS